MSLFGGLSQLDADGVTTVHDTSRRSSHPTALRCAIQGAHRYRTPRRVRVFRRRPGTTAPNADRRTPSHQEPVLSSSDQSSNIRVARLPRPQPITPRLADRTRSASRSRRTSFAVRHPRSSPTSQGQGRREPGHRAGPRHLLYMTGMPATAGEGVKKECPARRFRLAVPIRDEDAATHARRSGRAEPSAWSLRSRSTWSAR